MFMCSIFFVILQKLYFKGLKILFYHAKSGNPRAKVSVATTYENRSFLKERTFIIS